jgi:hypothetical protein
MRHATFLLLFALLAGCEDPKVRELRLVEIDIAQARQHVQDIRAARVRRAAEREATAIQFEDQPELVAQLVALHDETERVLRRIEYGVMADMESRGAALQARRRRLIEGAP